VSLDSPRIDRELLVAETYLLFWWDWKQKLDSQKLSCADNQVAYVEVFHKEWSSGEL